MQNKALQATKGEKMKTFKVVMQLLFNIAKASQIKVKRGFADFYSDRIIQASSQPNIAKFIETLMKLLDVDITEIKDTNWIDFMKHQSKEESHSVLLWIRQNPKACAMFATLKKAEFLGLLREIEIELPENNIDLGRAPKPTEYDIGITFTCLSPLSHGSDQKAGNATLFRRKSVLTDKNNVLELPFYAGNALRGQIRDILATDYLDRLGIDSGKVEPEVELWLHYALYSGGALEDNSKAAKGIGKKLGNNGATKGKGMVELRNMIPMVSLLGTALGNRVIPGRLEFGDYKPHCLEWNNGNKSIAELIEWQYLTRRDDYEGHCDGENHAMIANTECLKEGVQLTGGIDCDEHITDLEKSCLGYALKQLSKKGYIGASNRRGFGKVQVEFNNLPSTKLYIDYLEKNKEKIRNYLIEIGGLDASN